MGRPEQVVHEGILPVYCETCKQVFNRGDEYLECAFKRVFCDRECYDKAKEIEGYETALWEAVSSVDRVCKWHGVLLDPSLLAELLGCDVKDLPVEGDYHGQDD